MYRKIGFYIFVIFLKVLRSNFKSDSSWAEDIWLYSFNYVRGILVV